MIQPAPRDVKAGMTIFVSQSIERCKNGPPKGVKPAPVVRGQSDAAQSRIRGTVMSEDPEHMSRLIDAVARNEDVAAFEALFRHFGPKVKAYMMRRAGSPQIAEELMQETMMAVWNKAALFDADRGSPSAWIFTIARNQFISAYRKQNRPEFDPNDPAFVPAQTEPVDLGLESRQDAERVHAAMQALPAEQRELVQRSFFGEVSHNALAEELRLPLGTVKSRIRMAIAKLRKSLEER